MRNRTTGRLFASLAVALMSMAAGALSFQPIPKESAKALRVTRGKPFSSGVVFIDGKYIEPPYVVERWGTGLRINQIPVSGQLISWNEFLKTQEGVKVEQKTVTVTSAPVSQPATTPTTSSDADSSLLDDLFDDEPKPKAKAKKTFAAPVTTTRTVATYSLSGEFKPNDASKALVKRINASRTEIDRHLRSGGFICFGGSYSQVSGDKRTLLTMLESLPELQQRSETVEEFRAGVRAANLVYLNEVLCEELFKNRLDYRKLKERRAKLKDDQKWDQILEDVSDPIF